MSAQLAIRLKEDECDLPEILETLKTYTCYDKMIYNFPDMK